MRLNSSGKVNATEPFFAASICAALFGVLTLSLLARSGIVTRAIQGYAGESAQHRRRRNDPYRSGNRNRILLATLESGGHTPTEGAHGKIPVISQVPGQRGEVSTYA